MYVVTPPPFAILPSAASRSARFCPLSLVKTSVPTCARTPAKRGARPWPLERVSSLRGVRDISTQAPQATHELSRNVVPESGTIRVASLRSQTFQTNWPCSSLQIRTQRKQVMHCVMSTWMYGCDGSGATRLTNAPSDGETPYCVRYL